MRKSHSIQSNLYNSGLVLSSVEQLPNASASVAFTIDSGKVFREEGGNRSYNSFQWCAVYAVGCTFPLFPRAIRSFSSTECLSSLKNHYFCRSKIENQSSINTPIPI